jgi:lysine 2,3-aminomutase
MARQEEWQLELARAVTKRSELEKILKLTDNERRAIDALRDEYPVKISRHYLSLIDPKDPNDPLRKVVVPSSEELKHRPGESFDDVHSDEAGYQPCAGIIHRYPGKLLLLPTLGCPSHCRFCFRKGRKAKQLSDEEGKEALAYIREDPTIRDVIITGGEPLMLDDEELHYWLSSLRAIPHVEIVRITTRFPVYVPSRVTASFVKMLAEAKPVYMILSFVHPREITGPVETALNMLADAGIVLLQQGPLLRGVNDDTEVLKALYQRLAALRVLPYYAIWGISAPGTEHFMVNGERAAQLLESLENRTSGFCVPHLITIARGDKVRMIGWSPEKERVHLVGKEPGSAGAPARLNVTGGTRHS